MKSVPLTKAVRTLLFAVLWIAIIGMALPYLDTALYALRLTGMPVPSAMPMPVAGLKPSALRDTWHAARSQGRRHEGIDIFARKGTPVLATTEGIVLSQRHNTLGGKVVWVLGPGGQRHYYAHLDQFADLARGQRVVAGTLLGYVGNTGNARTTPPHLHYGIYGTAGALNPFPLLAQGKEGQGKPPPAAPHSDRQARRQ